MQILAAKTRLKNSETPLMKQYNAIKAKHPDALLLFRVGDFYETFENDAVITAKVLGIVLTKRANGSASSVNLAGFPYHSLDNYLPKLVRAGYRVAICEQLEDPKQAKTIVKRGVTELITPGVTINDNVLNSNENNFLCSISCDDKRKIFGIALLDVSTGEFLVTEGDEASMEKILMSFKPSEIISNKSLRTYLSEKFGGKYHQYSLEDWIFQFDFCKDQLINHFRTASLKGFGIEGLDLAITAAGACLYYLNENQFNQTIHINSISRIDDQNYVWLDNFTQLNLELLSSPHFGGKTLFWVYDRTITPMGSRLLKRWLSLPLKSITAIEERHQIVEYFFLNEDFTLNLIQGLNQINDLERLCGKIATQRINPRELVQLKRSLEAINHIKKRIASTGFQPLLLLADKLNPCNSLIEKLSRELTDDPPVAVNKGRVFRGGINTELDELRSLSTSGKDYLLNLQQREALNTGITSLKVAYNNVFGYYIEVSNAHKNKVPQSWIRKQTLVNAERYITEELKEYEVKILGAEEKILSLELAMYQKLVEAILEYIPALQINAYNIAKLDVLQAFSITAKENNYTKPIINDGNVLKIIKGRHPVIEKCLPEGEQYISNDVYLDDKEQQIMIITGPNMSGKSALLRQTALIVLMAQCGSFVPAEQAILGIVDKVFTRVGASDNLSSGESTFMVEMNETASILNNLSERSLVLLDEIGRGTSTYDGISIAWAIAEYLHENGKFRPKTLFATHYHELNEMEKYLKRIKNFKVSVKEAGDKIIFMRKLERGGSEHSFGIHVAELAGVPKPVVSRAKEILKQLEDKHRDTGKSTNKIAKENYQLSFFQIDDPRLLKIKEELESTDINRLTPVEALMKLNEMKRILDIE